MPEKETLWYYCSRCKRSHRLKSKLGQAHHVGQRLKHRPKRRRVTMFGF